MRILGLGGSVHDFSASLLEDGNLTVAIEDERINRVKHSLQIDMSQYPYKAYNYCLDARNIQISDVDLIVGNSILDKAYFQDLEDKVILINHHLAHAASTFFPSPFEDAAILVIDGCGSYEDDIFVETTTYYYGTGTEINEIKKDCGKVFNKEPHIQSENSIGFFYDIVSQSIGFSGFTQGKTMGLAPFGTDKYVNDFYRFYSIDDNGTFIQNRKQLKVLRWFITQTLASLKNRKEEQLQEMADFAYAVQYHLEKIVIVACNQLYNKTESENLCLAGGVALNSVANRKILSETPFKNIFIQPAAGDAGTSIGSALYGHHVLLKQPRLKANRLFSPYLGREYSNNEILYVLDCYKDRIKWEKLSDPSRETAKLLSEGKIIAWHQGRSEIGPRSLGNRSILADARNKDMKDIINSRIKHREMFRPFAPIVLEEKQGDYFELEHPSYYMLLVPNVRKEKQELIPSVTHVDGTGRVQTVSKKLTPPLYSLLTEFEKITGVPVLLNTSFNDNGEPIVESPEDSIRCFLSIDLDCLILHDYIIEKR
ncbi:carbamoyltransferase family protein [Paenibacillus sp. KN14-4R]|uniref:carbamoyltransferase family protein n=1 Tax=Paenibacillus sp. KN14-4R TaxID=3445773 RepID=UPI003FA160DB